jgi:glycosyltransferase involved in cell wall biosynthesis
LNNKIKILHIFGTMNRGGAELRTLELMKKLNHLFDFHFCVLSGNKGSLDDEITKLGGKVHYIKLKSFFTFVWRFYKIIKFYNFSVIHSHVHYVSGLMLLLAKIFGVNGRIAHFRSQGDGKSGIKRRFRNYLLKLLIKFFATDIVAVSKTTMKKAWEPNWEHYKRCKVIYNGFDIQTFNMKKNFKKVENIFTLVHVGRLDEAKNQMFLVRAFEDLQKKTNTNLELLFIGNHNNEYGEKVKKCVLERSINGVYFLGEKTNILPYLQQADLFVFPSIREGLPGALIEAILANKISITSDIEVIKELKDIYPDRIITLPNDTLIWNENILKLMRKNHLSNINIFECPFNIDNISKQFNELWEKY